MACRIEDEEQTHMQALDTKRVRWSENCVDPGSRVFFIGDRVFRAYEESRRLETLEFLNSDCYAELRGKRMIVKTWIAGEIQLEGYPLILEHERLCCMPEKWHCFEMLKDILAFHFEVNSICNKYGYGLRDIGYGNVTYAEGRLCFTDFGSFRRIENVDPNIFVQYCLPLAYLPLAIYSSNDGNDFIADCMIEDYDKWITACTKPVSNTLLTNHLWNYLHPIVQYYNLRVRRSKVHWRFRTRFAIWCVQKINTLFQPFVPIQYSGRNIIDVEPIYSYAKAINCLATLQSPYVGESIYPIGGKQILKYVPSVISQQIKHPIGRIVIWGNYMYEEIVQLRKAVDCELIVMSSDRMYCNHLYRQIRSNHDEIVVACCNAMRGKDFSVLNSLKTDLLVLQDEVYKQSRIGEHSDWAERASYFAEYILTNSLAKDEILSSRINGYYSCIEGTQDISYHLYQIL